MSNIPGVTLPGPYTDVITASSGTSIPGGSRIAAMIGQGTTAETIVSAANGGGNDGLNATFTSTTGSDGRHFQLQNYPLIANRTQVFKNGLPLTLLEQTPVPTGAFSTNYQCVLDPTTGELILQQAYLQDQGGSTWVPLTTNVGLGSVNNLALVDQDAPPEIWTIRCISVQRNSMNQPIPATATFIAIGSVSGSLLDANGNPIVWLANGQTVSNGILSFNITETAVMSVVTSPFRQGDGFTVIVDSGVLVRGDSLTSVEIPTAYLNAPFLTQGMRDVVNRHGSPSLVNNLALGAQLAYANGASSLLTVQAAPPLPRRTSYVLDPDVNALSTNLDEFQFPFPLGVVPDINSDIHVFVQNNTTLVETQVLPNKFPFYTLNTAQFPNVGQPTLEEFINSNANPPGGYNFSYTVIQEFESVTDGFDGYVGRAFSNTTTAVFSSPSVEFNSTYPGQILKIIDSNNAANIGIFNIDSVSDGVLVISTITTAEPPLPAPYNTPTGFPDFTSDTSVAFQLIDPTTGLVVTPPPTSSATDGTLVALLSTSTATLTSGTVDFANFSNLLSLRLQINGSAVGNDGLYDIIAYDPVHNAITLQMVFVTEHNVRWEVLDPDAFSAYLVLNRNVVPNGNQLRVTIVDARDAAFYDAGWLNALASLESVQCDILVPLPNQTISVIFQNALNHVITMSNIVNRKERVLFIGAINGLTPANLTGAQPAEVEDLGPIEGIPDNDITSTLAGNLQDLANYSVPDGFGNTYRCVYFYPDQIVVQAGSNNVMIDGFYLAAAAAGYESADLSIEDPLTNKVLTGFTILGNKQLSTLTLSQLAQAGVTTLQPVAGGGTVVWGITTTQSGFVEEQEISIVFIRDAVAKIMRAGVQSFIGIAADANFQAILNTRVVTILNGLVGQGLITAYANLSVVQDDVDPTQWNVSVMIQPTYPVNFIYITVTVGQLSTA